MKKILTVSVFLGFTLTNPAPASGSAYAGPRIFGPENAAEIVTATSALQTDENATSDSPPSSRVAEGRKQKVEGVIVQRQTDSLTLRDEAGTDLAVLLASDTKIVEKKKNPFRRANRYDPSILMRGLRVQVVGRSDGSGTLVAEKIKLRQEDLGVAQTIATQMEPVEQRLGRTENRLSDTEQNAERLSGQVEELVEVSNVARGGAKAAQKTADHAIASVHKTNERISALDDYEVVKGSTVSFKVGSAALSPEAQAELDEVAAEAKSVNGFVIEVAGFASADGDEELNRRLSQQRAEAVVRYLVEHHDIPLRRVLMPYGYGEARPMADNSTREGRQQNRRVEIKILVSRGLAMSDS